MINVMMVRTIGGLALSPEEPQDALKDLPRGQALSVSIKSMRPRSAAFHRKLMALMRVGHDNCVNRVPFDVFRRWMLLKAGCFEVGPDGTLIPRSISFSAMDADDFAKVYSNVLDYMLAHVLPDGTDANEVSQEVDRILGFL